MSAGRGQPTGRAPAPSAAREASSHIANAILVGTFEPGQQLVEEDLARELNVSRIPVREALQELSREGLVQIIPHRGTFVTRLDRQLVAELYDVRANLEGMAARLCAERIGQGDLDRLTELIGQMRQAAADRAVASYSELALRFRLIIIQTAPNRVLREMIRQVSRRTLKMRSIAMHLPGRLEESLASHQNLFEAIRNHDGRAAEMIRWLGVQQAKRAVLSGYFGESVQADTRNALDRSVKELMEVATLLEPSTPDPRGV